MTMLLFTNRVRGTFTETQTARFPGKLCEGWLISAGGGGQMPVNT